MGYNTNTPLFRGIRPRADQHKLDGACIDHADRDVGHMCRFLWFSRMALRQETCKYWFEKLDADLYDRLVDRLN